MGFIAYWNLQIKITYLQNVHFGTIFNVQLWQIIIIGVNCYFISMIRQKFCVGSNAFYFNCAGIKHIKQIDYA